MEEIIQILSEVTCYTYYINRKVDEEDYEVFILQENIMEDEFCETNPIGYLSIQHTKDKQILCVQLTADASMDMINIYMKAATSVMHVVKEVKIELENNIYLMDEMIRYYKDHGFPFYKPFLFLPFCKKTNRQYKMDFYQLPFLKPEEFLDLKYGQSIIGPKTLVFNHNNKDPIHLMCQREPDHTIYRLLPSTSFYQRSKRPITSMNLIRPLVYKAIDITETRKKGYKGGPINWNNQIFIPVVRYSYGMRRGCYFNPIEDDTQYVGTFYYWEPDADVFLCLGSKDKVQYYESKMDCTLQINNVLKKYIRFDSTNSLEYQDLLDESVTWVKKILEDMYKEFVKYYEKEHEELLKLYSSLKDTKETVALPLHPFLQENFSSTSKLKHLFMSDILNVFQGVPALYTPITIFYESKLSNKYMSDLFYAAEDELDQTMTKILAVIGLNGVVLGKMAGYNRIVSEVLDTRSRENSLNSLHWEIK